MQLESRHRLALLGELDRTKEELDSARNCLNKEEIGSIKEHFEISMFLAQQKIKLIEQSLIDNEIDF
jgi:hypothetical protein